MVTKNYSSLTFFSVQAESSPVNRDYIHAHTKKMPVLGVGARFIVGFYYCMINESSN